MKGKITFNTSGNKSVSGRLTIPAALIEIMGFTENDRDVEITYEDGKLIIRKINKEE